MELARSLAPVVSALACAAALAGCGAARSTPPPTTTASSPPPAPRPARPINPGTLPQTRALPSASSTAFRLRMDALWRGVASGSAEAAMPAFFPRAAYLKVKALANPGADYADRLVAAFRADIRAAHALVLRGGAGATLVGASVPDQWAWIPPGACANRIGYWHDPGSRLVYRSGGQLRSFGVFSLISWRGEWYVVHLSSYDQPGTVDDPAVGRGSYGPAGGC